MSTRYAGLLLLCFGVIGCGHQYFTVNAVHKPTAIEPDKGTFLIQSVKTVSGTIVEQDWKLSFGSLVKVVLIQSGVGGSASEFTSVFEPGEDATLIVRGTVREVKNTKDLSVFCKMSYLGGSGSTAIDYHLKKGETLSDALVIADAEGPHRVGETVTMAMANGNPIKITVTNFSEAERTKANRSSPVEAIKTSGKRSTQSP